MVRKVFNFQAKRFNVILFRLPLLRYDAEAIYFDEGVRKEKRLQLKSKALDVRVPPYLGFNSVVDSGTGYLR